MTLAELIARYRTAAHDTILPGFCTDEELAEFYNDADAEAAIRGRLLRTTAESHPSLCAIDVTAGDAVLSLHPAIYELSYQAWRATGATTRAPLALRTREWMDANVTDWRDMPADTPRWVIQEEDRLQLVPAPSVDGEVLLEAYRVPVDSIADDTDEPGIPAIHHRHLVHWALYRAFSKPDGELFDPARAAQAEAEFSRYFGRRPDSDLRRDTREDEPQHIVAWL